MTDIVERLRERKANWMQAIVVMEGAADEIGRLRSSLEDITGRLEASWERRDLAPDSDLEAVERARKLLPERRR